MPKIKNFHREITIKFLEMLLAIKLFHWKTTSYATHKATDELYTKLNENMDSFIEILLGKTESRINLLNQKSEYFTMSCKTQKHEATTSKTGNNFKLCQYD